MRGIRFRTFGATVALTLALGASAFAAPTDQKGQALLQALQDNDSVHASSLIAEKANVNFRDETGATPLLWAIETSNTALVSQLLNAGADPNIVSVTGLGPLQVAIDNRASDIALMLIAKGAKPNVMREDGETALMTAARTGQLDVMKQLIAKGADVNAHETKLDQTALMWSAGHPEQVKLLLANGANAKVHTKTWDVANTIYTQFFRTIGVTGIPWGSDGQYITKAGGQNAIFFAVQHDDLESVQALLDAGVDVNDTAADGATPLLRALYKWDPNGRGLKFTPNLKIANLLLDHGAKVNVVDGAGYTPLHAAILAIVPTVLQQSRGPRQRRQRQTAPPKFVYPADAQMGFDLVKRLVEAKADLNAVTIYPTVGPVGQVRLNPAPEGSSALHIASLARNPELMDFLLQKGGNPNLMRKDGHTPLSVAVKGNDLGVVKALVAHGGTIKQVFNPMDKIAYADKPIAEVRQNENLLHIAASAGSDTVIDYLVSQGLSLTMKNDHGETPLVMADEGERLRLQLAIEGGGRTDGNPDAVRDVKTSNALKKAMGEKVVSQADTKALTN